MESRVIPGAVVRGSDDQIVGRVRDIYLVDRSGELAAITVVAGQLSSRNVLIPAAAIAALENESADGPDAPASDVLASDVLASDAPASDVAADAPEAEDTTVRLKVSSMAVLAGIAAPVTGHATPQQLRLAARELGIEEAAAG